MPRSTLEQRREAKVMRARGLSLGQISYRLGFSKTTIMRWLDPAKLEHNRKKSLEWRRNHHARANAHARQWMRNYRPGQCRDCGKAIANPNATRCLRCLREETEWKRREIQTLWTRGYSTVEIAAQIGTSRNAVKGHITRMRADGWDLELNRAAA